jgi:hypothetical protein
MAYAEAQKRFVDDVRALASRAFDTQDALEGRMKQATSSGLLITLTDEILEEMGHGDISVADISNFFGSVEQTANLLENRAVVQGSHITNYSKLKNT